VGCSPRDEADSLESPEILRKPCRVCRCAAKWQRCRGAARAGARAELHTGSRTRGRPFLCRSGHFSQGHHRRQAGRSADTAVGVARCAAVQTYRRRGDRHLALRRAGELFRLYPLRPGGREELPQLPPGEHARDSPMDARPRVRQPPGIPATDKEIFLRGVQLTDARGMAEFTTIYPWLLHRACESYSLEGAPGRSDRSGGVSRRPCCTHGTDLFPRRGHEIRDCTEAVLRTRHRADDSGGRPSF
jgi:hypothetical protein